MKNQHARWKCLIVDDEPLAANLIQSYVETVEELQAVGVCHNALDAFALLRKQPVDLLFLDIQMPKLTGLEFLRALPNPPAVIITTAYREYAVEGFELDVADYLVKPVTLERFLKAVGKVMARQQVTQEETYLKQEEPYVYYKVDRQMVKVYLKEILWIESVKDYIKVVLEDNHSLLTYQRMNYAEEKLPASLFLRIHRSFIVARDKITAYGANTVRVGEKELPIGKSYKQMVHSELDKEQENSFKQS
ncbi:LytR/AlgR family response regulator transcription factor [Pontibacter cellulosilyticus]|uniref:Response regulator transcription factor n=1 Tax=Pontibacter cellulosilyticus TaxID=1720253 RepID=A0A923N5Q2_9BACT|nr:LytTR family DNA-binding domain-containing protein [Pontibacter cellulosilyticus]MBC5992232.1 response regulator transcription factor [Pontibacter cellulosilyticus]